MSSANSQQMLLVSGDAPATCVYIGTAASPFLAPDNQSITGVPIGPAASNKFVFIVVNWLATTSTSILSAAAIASMPAKIHANTGAAAAHAPGIFMGSAVISAPVSTGTTATVDLVFVAGSSGHQVWLDTCQVGSLLSDTPIGTIATSVNAVQPYAGNIDVKRNGILIVGAITASDAAFYVLSGATQDYQIPMNGADQTGIGGSLLVTADELGRSISINRFGGSGIAFNVAVVAASFR